MFDVLHFEGPLAHYTLRRWTARASGTRSQAERIRPLDEHEALTLLRHAVDSDTLRRLSAFMHESDVTATSPSHDPLELLWLVARRVVNGELVLERELIVPMASDTVERTVIVLPPPIVNDIADGVGLQQTVQADAEQSMLAAQAKQANVLREAASNGKSFCEHCAGAHQRHVPESEQDVLTTQARQAEALRAAAHQGSAFCEKCANCQPALPLAQPLVAPPSELGSQAKQADALTRASESGKAFCEHCRC